jgi:hypothetical protein
MKRIAVLVVMCMCVSSAFVVSAQGPPAGPPKVIMIEREEIKPGKMTAHEKLAHGYVQAFANSKSATHWIGMTPVAGNENEAFFITPYPSYAAIEKDRHDTEKMMTGALKAAVDQLDKEGGDIHASSRQLIAEYREDLSYNAPVNLPQMRYFEVTTTRVRPGHERAFEEARKIVKAAHEKAKVDEHFAIYEVGTGTVAQTYLTLIPFKSLAEWDVETHAKPYLDALGEGNRQKIDKMRADGVISIDSTLYAINPMMSYAPPEYAAADPGFWGPKKAATTKTAAAKKPATKPAAKTQ